MKRSLIALATVLTAALCAALPLTWRADWPDAKPVETLVHRGTDIEFQPQWYINGELANSTNWTFQTFVQTNAQATGEWFGPLPGAAFSHTNDIGAAFYNVMVRAAMPGGAVNYTAFARLRMLDSPGFAPGELPLPVPFIDFSRVVALNAPWLLQTDFSAATNTLSAAIGGLAQNLATNYFTAAETKARTDEAKAIGGYALETAERALDTTVTINSKIPSAASQSNQLADKAWTEGQLAGKLDKSGGTVGALWIYVGSTDTYDYAVQFQRIPVGTGRVLVWGRRPTGTSNNWESLSGYMLPALADNSSGTFALLSDVAVKSIKLNGAALTPDANGAVDIPALPLRGGELEGTLTLANQYDYPGGGLLTLKSSNGDVSINIGLLNDRRIVLYGGSGGFFLPEPTLGNLWRTFALAATNPTAGNLAVLDSQGNPTNSGIAKASVATKPANFTPGNLASFDTDGNLTDSGYRLEVRNGIPYIVETTNN